MSERTTEGTVSLNEGQAAAVDAMIAFLKGPEQTFVLKGPAGTGKTFCLKELVARTKSRLIFTAPTNKATKVLRDSLTTPDYKPECRTIFSLLGLRLEASGEVRELKAPEDPVDLSKYAAIIIDECSMIGKELRKYINLTLDNYDVKVIYLGDDAQLPPVKEPQSLVWKLPVGAALTEQMRNANGILRLVTDLRLALAHPAPSAKFASDNDGETGVWKLCPKDFEASLQSCAAKGKFLEKNGAKAIAWRNVTVDKLNETIRQHMFPESHTTRWLPGERIILTEPASDREGKPLATTDDEGTIQRIVEDAPGGADFRAYNLSVLLDEGRTISLRVLHESSEKVFAERLEALAQDARANPRKWKLFWDRKAEFHSIRYSYALTAHRSQGSTYETVFVDWQDILTNRNRHEAFQCLYVACSRAKRVLVIE